MATKVTNLMPKKKKKSLVERVFGGKKIKGVKGRTTLPPERGSKPKQPKITRRKTTRKKTTRRT